MFTTTLSILALAAALNTTSASPAPGWQADYAQALTFASADQKPIAVFIGHGGDKIKHMLADGTIPAESARLLRDSYVCVYLNTDTSVGKEMSARFALPEGLVISGPGGGVQALRHEGTISGADLTKQLAQYATAGQPITTVTSGGTTIQSGSSSPAFVYGGCPNGQCPLSAAAATQYVYPSGSVYPSTNYVYPSGTVYSFGTSSCPNGRCPNQR